MTHAGVHIALIQQTEFPASDHMTIRVEPASPIEFALQLRIPAWASGSTISINGRRHPLTLKPGSAFTLKRLWKAGDTVELTLPQTFRTEPIDESHPGTVALMRGPVEYVALNTSGAKVNTVGAARPKLSRDLKPAAPQAYDSSDKTFVPLYTVQSETYGAYFDV